MIKLRRESPDLYRMAGWTALLAVLAAGWYLRAKILFATELIPGKNGAYYPVQVRALLRTGHLGIPDFPLLFWVQAVLAKTVSFFEPLHSAIIHTTKISDVFFPVLLVIPVYLLVTRFSRSSPKSTAIAGILSVGIFTVTNRGLLEMAGEFQKNSTGLTVFLLFAYFLYRALEDHQARRYSAALFFFCMACLIHIGVTALSISFFTIVMATYIVRIKNRKRGLIIIAGVVASLACCLTVVYLIDPERIRRLIGITFNLRELFAGSTTAQRPGIGPDHGVQFRTGKIVIGNILGLMGIATIILDRKHLTHASQSILIGGALTALLFASPFIGGDWSERLGLMAFVPALIPLSYMSVRIRWGWFVTALLAVTMTFYTLKTFDRIPHEKLTVEAYRELTNTATSDNTLVIARHGLEWWAAWAMDVKIANNPETVLDVWDDYDTILYLEETGNDAFTGNGGIQGVRGPRDMLPPELIDGNMHMPFGPPPSFEGGMEPPPGRPEGDMQLISTLETSVLTEGKYFRLSEILYMPEILDGQIPELRVKY